ncbi:hypothetical protein [uncultured Parabacteroides sp.]|jgi:hypothetical protein|uniref:hypothetical protein n=1 Tax=uncultured Parabacteroides sp. TaxID=512312 RepID=UPI0025E6DC54|nr:hypothetical protein [uncultured Parabacteroides sp.]
MKQQKKLEALFPKGILPDVDEFNRSLDAMSAKGRKLFREKIYRLAFLIWHALPQKHRIFIIGVIIHDRQAYADFVIQETVIGYIRYPLRHPALFIRMLHLTEAVERTASVSLNGLAMSVIISFETPWGISTMRDKISKGGITSEEVLILAGKVTVLDYYGG